MSLIQILECNNVLGTCCNDYGLVLILDSFRKALSLIQMFVPIILIVASCYELIRLMARPDAKGGIKPLINKYIAAAICFFIPMCVDVVLGMMPETFSVSACWEQAKVSAEVVRSQKNTYISTHTDKPSPMISNPDDYGVGATSGTSSAKGKAIVNYAKEFVGVRYLWGGTWSGEKPYTPTDCSGFVQGVFRHNGINLTRTTYTQWADKNTYTLVTGDIKAGDLVMYDGHVGILTGNGTEIIHNNGRAMGVSIDPDYRLCSSHAILGIMRIKGVN